MDNETCKCYECGKEIATNMAHTLSRVSRYTGKIFYLEMCDECWWEPFQWEPPHNYDQADE